MNDGLCWPVKADRYDDEAGQEQTECPEESHDSASAVISLPLHSDVPTDLQWHHQKGHLKHSVRRAKS